jgi:multiple sugar transport system permease protein
VIIWGTALNENSQGQQAVLREFQKRHPEYNLRAISMGAGGTDPQKLMTAVVGNVAPDVIIQDRFTISDWASRGAFESLNNLIARDIADPEDPLPKDYYPSTWQEVTYDGQVYGIPAEADNRALYWNRALFRQHAAELEKAGLDPNRPPRTWTELLAYSKTLTEFSPDGTLKIAGFIPNYGNSWLYMYAFQNDAKFISADGRTCTADSKESEEALQFIVDGYQVIGGYDKARNFESGFLSDENDPFILGKVAMKIDGNWRLNSISQYAPTLDYAVDPAPVPDARFKHLGRFAKDKDTFITWTGGFSYAIPKGAKNTAGGWAFIKFATSVEGRLIDSAGQAAWDRYKGRTYIFVTQSNKDANAELYRIYKPADPKLAAALKTHIDLMSHARVRPVTFVGQVMWDELQRALENACQKSLTPHQALLRAQHTVQHELDAYYDHTKHPELNLQVVFWSFVAAGVLALLVLVLLYKRMKLGKLHRHDAKWGYLLISPWIVGFVVFTLGPMIASLFLSFTEYNDLTDARWVGMANYAATVTSDKMNVWKAFSNAFYLAGVGVPLGIFTGLAIAMLLNTRVRGLRWYRTIFYMPAIVPTIPSAILWTWVLSADPSRGLVNSIWAETIQKWISLPAPGWLQSEAWAKPALIVMGLWGAGSGMILWLAGLKGVPRSLYEAAEIDGAGPRKQFLSITVPQLSPIIFFNAVIGIIGALQEFDRVYVMKPSSETAGPGDSLLVPVFYLFRNGFGYFKMGYASALAWLIFLIILILTAIQFKLAPSWVNYEADG